MTQYITRVELHSATELDYERLHSEMAKKGFSRRIIAVGTAYDLPSAEYHFQGDASLSSVFSFAQQAANETGKRSWILVTQMLAIRFNLSPARTLLRR